MSSTPASSSTSRLAIAATIALVVCALLLVSLIIFYIIRQYRRRMSQADASMLDLEAAETRSDYSSFDDEKKYPSATPSIVSIPESVYAPHSSATAVPMTHEQRMREVDIFFGGAPLQRTL